MAVKTRPERCLAAHVRKVLRRYADARRRAVRDKAGTEDIVHDVFVALARSAAHMGYVRNLKAYVMTCAANRARELLGSRMRQTAAPADEPAAEYSEPIDALIDDEAHRQLIAAMDQLPYSSRKSS